MPWRVVIGVSVAMVSRLDSFSRLNARVGTLAGLDGWTWHDFRRSFAIALGEGGTPEAMADAVLNHRQAATRGGVLGVYRRASRWPEQARAMEHWGRLLRSTLDGKTTDSNLVAIPARAG